MDKFIIILLFGFLIASVSCVKEDVAPAENNTQSVIDNISAENSTENIFNIVNDYGLNLLSESSIKTDSGVVVSITPLYPLDLYPKTMIINYGNGISCSDGVLRKGKIVAVFSNKWSIDSTLTGVNVEITLNEYYADNIQYMATIEVGMNNNSDNGIEFNLQTSNAKMLLNDGTNVSWNTQRTIKWISGSQTIDINTDDIFLISSNTTGISRKGSGFESNTKEPLRFDNSCINGTLTQGIIDIIPEDQAKHTVDFGNGNCDRDASLTVNGITVDFTF